MTVYLECESIDPDDGHSVIKYGKIVFVDLAGRYAGSCESELLLDPLHVLCQ